MREHARGRHTSWRPSAIVYRLGLYGPRAVPAAAPGLAADTSLLLVLVRAALPIRKSVARARLSRGRCGQREVSATIHYNSHKRDWPLYTTRLLATLYPFLQLRRTCPSHASEIYDDAVAPAAIGGGAAMAFLRLAPQPISQNHPCLSSYGGDCVCTYFAGGGLPGGADGPPSFARSPWMRIASSLYARLASSSSSKRPRYLWPPLFSQAICQRYPGADQGVMMVGNASGNQAVVGFGRVLTCA